MECNNRDMTTFCLVMDNLYSVTIHSPYWCSPTHFHNQINDIHNSVAVCNFYYIDYNILATIGNLLL